MTDFILIKDIVNFCGYTTGVTAKNIDETQIYPKQNLAKAVEKILQKRKFKKCNNLKQNPKPVDVHEDNENSVTPPSPPHTP